MHGVDVTAQTLNRLTMALDGAVDSLIVPLEILVGCFVAGLVFALCALACIALIKSNALPPGKAARPTR
jgi:hypothetical protein